MADGTFEPSVQATGIGTLGQRHRRKQPCATAKDTAIRRLIYRDEAHVIGTIMRAREFAPVDALPPPGSVLDAVVRAIRTETDCPPELAVVST